MEGSRVLVTGITGQLGSNLMLQLLEHRSNFRIRGTVRSLTSKKLDFLKDVDKSLLDRLELVEADLTNDDVWDSVIEGCDFVCHVANPTTAAKFNDKSFLEPAMAGIKAILAACTKHGVKRLVLTGSSASCIGGRYDLEELDDTTFGDPEKATPYERSKILSERYAWDYVKSHPELELVVILCGFILGPNPSRNPFPAGELLGAMMSRKLPFVFNMRHCVIDVRDCAAVHVLSLESPKAAGQRYICNSGEHIWVREMRDWLQEELKLFGYRLPTFGVGRRLCMLASIFDVRLRTVYVYLDRAPFYNNKKLVEDLGIEFKHSARDAVLATGYQCIVNGQVKDKTNGLAAQNLAKH